MKNFIVGCNLSIVGEHTSFRITGPNANYKTHIGDWEHKSYKIITWIPNTSSSSINILFRGCEIEDDLQSFLAERLLPSNSVSALANYITSR